MRAGRRHWEGRRNESGFGFAFDVVFEIELLAVEHGVGEELDPVAEEDDARAVGEHEVVVEMAVPENEKVDVGVILEIGLGKEDEGLFVLALEGRFAAVFALEAAVFGPLQAETYAPTRMEGGKEPLRHGIVEEGAKEGETATFDTETVAVGEVENLVGDLDSAGRGVEYDTALFDQIIAHPQVVVAREVVYFDTKVGEFGEFA